ncbi:conserved hypothetical protein [Bradyrhizobium sp. ORS 375]|uniref:hypothetical protein n=1 Tax=Bradyrhizobium sp. (strain ORS 375) TaxID=566679 RepID=UPI00024090FE|nr:hypothetical protein [Bradyrhizobium sp. ORS 375]CCD93884.1 conserved hypothetical protein [Bradyrhizobium sp. ORS 375]
MERWKFIGWGIAASVLAHLMIVGSVVVSTTVRPYELAKTDEIKVDIVDAEEPQKTPEPVPTPLPSPSPELSPPQPAPSASPAAAAPPPQPSQAATPEARESSKPAATASPVAKQPAPVPSSSKAAKMAAKSEPKAAARPAPAPMPAPAPSYVPPEPDLTVKYGVMLGLPEPLSPLPRGGGPDDKDAGPIATTNLAPNLETALRQKVRSCARLPASLSLSDKVLIRLRFGMTPDGKLATEPEVIEVMAASKAIQLKESAVQALTSCQPYTMLPPDRYNEWKVIEMSFTPQDFDR